MSTKLGAEIALTVSTPGSHGHRRHRASTKLGAKIALTVSTTLGAEIAATA